MKKAAEARMGGTQRHRAGTVGTVGSVGTVGAVGVLVGGTQRNPGVMH